MKNNSSKAVLSKLMVALNMTLFDFSIAIGEVSVDKVESIMKKNDPLDADITQRIKEAFIGISEEFLKTGNDPIFLTLENDSDTPIIRGDGARLHKVVQKSHFKVKDHLLQMLSSEYDVDLWKLYLVNSFNQKIKDSISHILGYDFAMVDPSTPVKPKRLVSVQEYQKFFSIKSFVEYIVDTKTVNNKTDLASLLGYSRTYVTEILNGTIPPSESFEKRLKNTFPDDWDKFFRLETSRLLPSKEWNSQMSNAVHVGDPIGEHKRGENTLTELSSGKFLLKTKLVSAKATAGYLTGWGDPEYLEALPFHEIIVDKPVAGEYISFEVRGDSMDDGSKESIESGSVATGRKIDRRYWRNKLHLKKFQDFIIVCNNTVTNEGGIIVKRILEHNTEENYILCHSLNPDKKSYPDFKLQMIDVIQIFNVVQITRKYNA